MKNRSKVREDRIKKIEINHLKVEEYKSDSEIVCSCIDCNRKITNNYRNLSYENFKCSFCDIYESSPLVKNNIVRVLEVKGGGFELLCGNGHTYWQDRRNLLKGKKCLKCYLNSKIIKKEDVIVKIREVHGDFFTYDMSNFINLHSKINIICKRGHEFSQKVSNHLQGKGCPICNQSFGERFIEKYLVENGASMNIKDDLGWTPWTEAIANGHLDIVKYFVKIASFIW